MSVERECVTWSQQGHSNQLTFNPLSYLIIFRPVICGIQQSKTDLDLFIFQLFLRTQLIWNQILFCLLFDITVRGT